MSLPPETEDALVALLAVRDGLVPEAVVQKLLLKSDGSKRLARLLVASLAMSAVLLWMAPESDKWLDWNWWERSLQLALLVASGLLVYLAAQGILGTRLRDFYTQKPH